MAHRLRKLRVTEISLVKRGANQRAEHVLLKSLESAPMSDHPMQRFMSALRKALQAVTPTEQHRTVAKALDDAEAALAEPVPSAATPETPMAKCSKCGADCTDDVEKAGETVLKGATPEQLELITKAQDAATKANERAERLEKAEQERVAIAKATELLGDLPGATPAELAPVLAKLAPAEQTVLAKLFDNANKAVAMAKLFEEVGARGTRTASGNAKLDSVAKELVKNFPELTMPQAIAKALEIDPSLYEDTPAPKSA